MLLTRLLGFVRERVFAQYFGISVEADAFGAALRIPNAIRNLLGEGTLSASFIPVFAGMLERGEEDDARRLASAVVSLLVLLTAGAALVGIVLAPIITDFAAPGFSGRQRDLTVVLVRILFPMSALLILSAWCLGVLSTHRRFFLAYAAPAVWNIAQIVTLVALGGLLLGESLAVALAWGAVAGSLLQIGVQLPMVLRLLGGVRWSTDLGAPGVQRVMRAWIPVIIGAGVIQISSIIDTQLASLLGSGSVASLRYAQLLANLPIALFGVSVSAAALPELSRDVAGAAGAELHRRMGEALRQLSFFVVPSAFAFASLGPQLVGAIFQTGAFDARDTDLVGGVVAAYALAVPAQATIKVLASGHYAAGDTRTPMRIAALAVTVSAVSAFTLMQFLDVAGIALGSAIGAYVNVSLNTWRLRRRIGPVSFSLHQRPFLTVALGALGATAAGRGVAMALPEVPIWLEAFVAACAFAAVYAAVTLAGGHPEARRIASKLFRRRQAR